MSETAPDAAPRPILEIDPSSEAPLYQQIAEGIRARIESGALSPGDALEPLREAAERWGVNLHTVRHAYTALARAGLVETGRGPRGTRVSARGPGVGEIDGLIDQLVSAAGAAGVSADAIAERVRRRAAGTGSGGATAWVAECSAWQCRAHIEQLRTQFDVEARACVLGVDDPPPAGSVILATFFHYNDIRRLWPERLRSVRFVTIAPRAGLLDECAGARRLVVLEADEPTAENVAADLRALPGAGAMTIEARASSDVASSVAAMKTGEVALLAPRVWSGLPESVRSRGDVVEIVYEWDRAELRVLGAQEGWRSV